MVLPKFATAIRYHKHTVNGDNLLHRMQVIIHMLYVAYLLSSKRSVIAGQMPNTSRYEKSEVVTNK